MSQGPMREGPGRESGVREVASWRLTVVAGVLALGAGIVLARAFELQVLQNDFLTAEGNKRALRTVTVPAHRGAIRDRRGEPLALSAPVESLWVIPGELLEAQDYLPPLSKLLGFGPGELKKFLRARKEKHFVYLRRHLSPDDARRVMALKAPGVFSQREYRRYYPAGEVAGHVVGFTNIDGRGAEGMESAQDAALAGKPGARRVLRDRSGRVVEEGGDFEVAEAGGDLTLTLDLRLQYVAYRELKAAVRDHRARGGLIVVVDAHTGEILAMANQPGYNPNRPDDRDGRGLRNRAVTDIFEPGSTVKPLLVATALEMGRYRPDSRIDTSPGQFKVGSLTVRDKVPNGEVSLARMLSRSSNVGAARIGLALGPEAIWRGYHQFGLDEAVGSGYPGEQLGVLRAADDWGQVATATASYGYGLSVNALQLVRAYAAIANDGLLPALRVVHGADSAPPQRAVSVKVARQVRRLMEEVTVGDGTGVQASVPGYRVAGKTGTVRKPIAGGYADDRHQSVFIGMVPAEQPRLVGLVMIDEPGGDAYYGGQVAGPVFSRVMQSAVRQLQLAPDGTPLTHTAGVPARAQEPRT
ncbi:MAG TPA: penicillin-binding protein 2 [Verrucomicrobiae bacterium]|nr:penicillin-binding protein 2 [Verrucomicrobiae bacterium]